MNFKPFETALMTLLNIIDLVLKLDLILKNRLILSLFSLLISVLLIYFWNLSKVKMKVTGKDGSGLIYLSFAFLLYFLLGIISVFDINKRMKIEEAHLTYEQAIEGFTPLLSYYLISGLISFCFLSSLSFFSTNKKYRIDRIVSKEAWKNGIKYFAFFWIIIITTNQSRNLLIGSLDVTISVLSLIFLGFFITKYFILRNLKFIGLISGIFFTTIIAMQVIQSLIGNLGDKLIKINTFYLAPALASSVIILSYTFNWINELNFYELSKMWVSNNDENINPDEKLEFIYSTNIENWKEKIAKDDIEKVIQEIIVLKKYKNESIEDILNIASRNTRNNNNHLKNIIKYEDYQLNRNQISNSLIMMLKK